MKDLRAIKKGRDKTVAACVGVSPAYGVFWQPLTLAVLNAHPDEAAAVLLWRVLAQTLLKGGAFARPVFARESLGAALIEPALAALRALGADVRLGQRVRSLDAAEGRIAGLDCDPAAEVLGAGDVVVVAVPHFAVHDVLPELAAPQDSRAILNVHYRLPDGFAAPSMTGLARSPAQWVFVRSPVASVTVSAADAWMDRDADATAAALWPDVAAALGADAANIPPFRVIKERRATFAQTPGALVRRAETATRYENVFVAGDWTATDLPATIEGALKSGRLAAEQALAH